MVRAKSSWPIPCWRSFASPATSRLPTPSSSPDISRRFSSSSSLALESWRARAIAAAPRGSWKSQKNPRVSGRRVVNVSDRRAPVGRERSYHEIVPMAIRVATYSTAVALVMAAAPACVHHASEEASHLPAQQLAASLRAVSWLRESALSRRPSWSPGQNSNDVQTLLEMESIVSRRPSHEASIVSRTSRASMKATICPCLHPMNH